MGLAAVQIAKLMGARVIATASTDDKLARIGPYGADHLVNYANDERWDATVRQVHKAYEDILDEWTRRHPRSLP